ncbi:hypothetical protein GCM10028777_34040 [Angustibacter speluncae]
MTSRREALEQSSDAPRCAVLRPAVAHAAHRAGADAVGLVSLGAPVGLDLELDRVGVRYGDGPVLGDPDADVQVVSRVVGPGRLPGHPLPPVVARAAAEVDVVDAVVDAVPAGALPVVTSTWALSRLRPARREAFLAALRDAASSRPLAWVSVEGVGVAPSVPTLGDRPASGHSIVAVALVDAGGPQVEVVGRCWSRGRVLSWLAAPT